MPGCLEGAVCRFAAVFIACGRSVRAWHALPTRSIYRRAVSPQMGMADGRSGSECGEYSESAERVKHQVGERDGGRDHLHRPHCCDLQIRSDQIRSDRPTLQCIHRRIESQNSIAVRSIDLATDLAIACGQCDRRNLRCAALRCMTATCSSTSRLS